ncbi:hypothetical protein BT69DRAFT_1348622 [Atractiella rhizophila]|nr:hypothetical protein BT69DRAFT_1348622 [Atractiella rhizophila]
MTMEQTAPSKPTSSRSQILPPPSPPRPASEVLSTSQGRERRSVQTHSIPISYAYGAANNAKPRSSGGGGGDMGDRDSIGGGSSGRKRARASLQKEGEAHLQDDASVSSVGAGGGLLRSGATEAAAVRYARLKERVNSTGVATAPPHSGGARQFAARPPVVEGASKDTSINIATAFREAQARQFAVGGGQAAAAEGQKETHFEGEDSSPVDVLGKRKRKKRKSQLDPTYKHVPGETNSDDSSAGEGIGATRGKRPKKSVEFVDDGTAPPPKKKQRRKSNKKGQEEETATSDSDEEGGEGIALTRGRREIRRPEDSLEVSQPAKKRRSLKKKNDGGGEEEETGSDEEGGEGIALSRSRRTIRVPGETTVEQVTVVKKTRKSRKNAGDEEETASDEEGGDGIALTRGRRNLGGIGDESPDASLEIGPKKRKTTRRTKDKDGAYVPGETEESEEYDESGRRVVRRRRRKSGAPGQGDELEDVTMMDADSTATFYLRPGSPSTTTASVEPSAEQSRSLSQQNLTSTSSGNILPSSLRGIKAPQAHTSLASVSNGRIRDLTNASQQSLSGVASSSYDFAEEERMVKEMERKAEVAKQKKIAEAQRVARESNELKKRKFGPAKVATVTPVTTEEVRATQQKAPRPPPPTAETSDVVEPQEPSRISVALGGAIRNTIGVLSAIFSQLGGIKDWLVRLFRERTSAFIILSLLSLVLFASLLSGDDDTGSSGVWLPPMFQKHRGYTPPNLPPESIERLTHLERALGDLSRRTETEHVKVDSKFKALERDMANERKKRMDEEADIIASLRLTAKTVDTISGEWPRTLGSIKQLNDAHADDIARLKTLERGLDRLATKVDAHESTNQRHFSGLEGKLEDLKKEVASHSPDKVAQIAIDAIESKLPARLAVQMDPKTGRLDINPAFWMHLRDAFVDKTTLELELAKRPAGAGGDTTTTVTVRQPTWQEFLVANEASLKTWIDADVQQKVGSGVVVSRATFLDILKREIQTLKTDSDKKFNENLNKLGQEILDKTRVQTQQIIKDSASPKSRYTTKTGDDIASLVESLIDEALLRYSKDTLARPDYALYSAGGRVIPELTSEIYSVRPKGFFRRIIASATGRGIIYGLSPVHALSPQLTPGSCWPFKGSKGNLGVLLSRRIVVTDVTIEHAAKEVNYDMSLAPRNFEVWGVIEDKKDVERLRQDRIERNKKRAEALARGEDGTEFEEPEGSVPQSPNHILLASGSYDVDAKNHIQTFPANSLAERLQIPVGVVVLKVMSNHGNKDVTCLYRLRVHGFQLEKGESLEM